MAIKLDDYVTVAERIEKFYKKFPEGSLQSDPAVILTSHAGLSFVYVRAAAFRTPGDQRPGIGSGWCPIPGVTQFTKNSEAMNAETAAFGRAIAALGFDVKKGVASRDEMAHVGPAGRTAAVKPAHVEPLFKKVKAALGAELITKDDLKLQLTAGGVPNPKGTKGDLARITPEKAEAISAWLDKVSA